MAKRYVLRCLRWRWKVPQRDRCRTSETLRHVLARCDLFERFIGVCQRSCSFVRGGHAAWWSLSDAHRSGGWIVRRILGRHIVKRAQWIARCPLARDGIAVQLRMYRSCQYILAVCTFHSLGRHALAPSAMRARLGVWLATDAVKAHFWATPTGCRSLVSLTGCLPDALVGLSPRGGD